MMNSAHCHLAF